MSTGTKKILLILNADDASNGLTHKKVRRYQQLVTRIKKIHTVSVEWHLAYVTPAFPHYTLVSPALIELEHSEKEHGKNILRNAGRILNIPASKQYLLAGNPDVQDERMGKSIGADRIIGFSPAYRKYRYLKKQFREAKNRCEKFFNHIHSTAFLKDLSKRLHISMKH